jgi:hypothetical protein
MAYQPAGNLTSSAGLAHLQSLYYKKRALDRLQKKFVFRSACEKDMIPKQVGRSVQFFRYTNFSASTTETTEGTVGSSLSLTSRILNATVSQYTAFITVSDLLKDTAIDPIVQAAGELLGYQAGLSVDTITRGVIDAESSSTNVLTQTTPNRYRTYFFGKGGCACVDLEGRGPTDVRDPRKQRFNINVIPGQKQIADPEGVIGAAVSYNFVFTTVVLEGPSGIGGTYRYKTLDPQSTIG